jgi:adenylate cyclase
MAVEIERKFLVRSDAWKSQVSSKVTIRQGYLSNNKRASVRVRTSDDKATINIKGMTIGIQRLEYEYPMPLDEAHQLLDKLCEKPLIEKVRYYLNHHGKTWEIDVFSGDNAGLTVAEIELDSVDEAFEIPDWAGKEVTHLERYYNVCLTFYPYKQWLSEEKAGKGQGKGISKGKDKA